MMMLPRRLNARIILIVSLVLLVIGASSGWISARNQMARLLATMRLDSSIMVRNLAESCAHYLLVQDYAGLETFLLTSAELPDIRRIQVCEVSGALIWDVEHAPGEQPRSRTGIARLSPPVSRSVTIAATNDLLTIWQPIEAGNLLGWFRTDYSLSTIRETQAKTWEDIFLLTMARVCISALLIILFLRPVVRSISALTAFANRLNEHKGAQIDISGQPLEIVELGTSLNEASLKLYSTEQLLLNEQERLRKSEENYRRLLDTVQEGIWVTDTDAITTFVNPRMAEILGFTPEEMIGKPLCSFMDVQGKLLAEFNTKRRKHGIKEQHEFEFITKQGERIYTRLETGPVCDETGQYVGSIAAVADITASKQAELRLRASEQAFRAVVENAPDVIVRYDREGRRIYVNPEFERVNQLTAQEVLGKKPLEISTELAPVADVFTEKLMAAMASGTVTKIDLSWSKEGKALCWFVRVVPEFDADGAVVSALTIWSDITERKQNEAETRKLNEELEQRVQERTAELAAKNTELERMNRLFVGRELRMVELKERIRSLENRTGA